MITVAKKTIFRISTVITIVGMTLMFAGFGATIVYADPPGVCGPHGTSNGSGGCTCEDHWTGPLCDQRVIDTNGECDINNSTGVCEEGSHCEVRNPVSGNGICVADTCPTGTTGTPPNCVADTCPTGTTGTPPNCVAAGCSEGTHMDDEGACVPPKPINPKQCDFIKNPRCITWAIRHGWPPITGFWDNGISVPLTGSGLGFLMFGVAGMVISKPKKTKEVSTN